MLRFGAKLRLRIAAIVLALLFPYISSSWAAASEEEVCDVNADYALGREDYSAAIALHHKVLRTHKDNALAHYHLGFAYGMTGRTTDEISEYLLAARLGLDKWDLSLNLGLAYLGQNDWPKAIKALRTAVSRGPDHPEAHYSLAIAYEKANDLREALTEITASIQLAPEDPDERNTKAIIFAELGDLVSAHDEWDHLLQVAPDYAPARVNLAILNGSHTRLSAITSRRSIGSRSRHEATLPTAFHCDTPLEESGPHCLGLP
jgi:tetratricopeptide (TPR) repeat protein